MIVELTGDHKRRMAALAVPGGYWDNARGAYCVDDPLPRAAAAAIALFPELLNRYPELLERRDAAYGDARPTDFATPAGLKLGVELNGVELYDWQDIDAGYIRAILERDGGGNVLWDRGLGKTTVTAAFAKKLDARFTLVACRNDAKEPVWRAQLKELLPEHNIVVLPNPKVKRERCLEMVSAYDFGKAPLVFVVHYESLALIAGDKGKGKGWDALPEIDLFAFDEGHRLASMNPNSPSKNTQMGKGTMKARKRAHMVLNLTGSSILGRAEDLFGQLHFLYPKVYKAKWRDFNDRFLDYVKDGNSRVCIGFKPERVEDLRRELGVFSVFRKKSEVLDLPPLIKQDIRLELLPAQRKAYENMRDSFWAQLEDGSLVTATNVLSQLNHLRRLATHVEDLPSAKLDFALSELGEEPDKQFVVYTWFRAPGRALAAILGDEAVVIDGEVKPERRGDLIEQHRAGNARVLIGSIATIGESLNLQHCSDAIRLDRSWTPAVNDQTVDRQYRHGQQFTVVVRDLIAKDTVDELQVLPRLSAKESLRKALFGA